MKFLFCDRMKFLLADKNLFANAKFHIEADYKGTEADNMGNNSKKAKGLTRSLSALAANFALPVKSVACIKLMAFCLLFVVFSLFTGFFAEDAYAAASFKIYDYSSGKTTLYDGIVPIVTLNGAKIGDDRAQGILVNGVALLPYDIIFEKSLIAADCSYDKSKESVTISKYGIKISLTVGSKKAVVNGKTVNLSVAPMKVKYVDSGLTKILVPSRFVSESLGLGYIWNSSQRTISIEKKTISLSYNNGAIFEYSNLQTRVSIDGVNIDLGKMPGIIVNNIAMLRAKRVFSDSAIAAEYSYNSKDKKITLKKGDRVLVMTIGSKTAYLNDKKIELENAPLLVTNHETGSSYVMVPGRSTAASLGYDYVWDKAASTSRISSKASTDSSGGASSSNNSQGSDASNSNTSTNNPANTAGSSGSNLNQGSNNTGGSLSGGNQNGSNVAPELGDDGVYAGPSRLLYEWNANTLLYNSNGVRKIAGSMSYNGIVGQVYYATYDSINRTANSDTFMFVSSLPFGDITSSSNAGVINISVKNFACVDQFYQLNESQSKMVNIITMYNNSGNNEAIIQLNVRTEDYQYDISMTDDKQILFVTVYKNAISKAQLGLDDAGDCIVLDSLAPVRAELTDYEGQIIVKLPYVVNALGDFSSGIEGAKFIRHINVSSADDATYILLTADPGYEYYFAEKDNKFILLLRPQGSILGQSDSNPDDWTDLPDDDYEEPETVIKDKSSYEIVIPRPADVKRSMISDEDFYHDGYFVIRLKGDYTGFFGSNSIKQSSANIKEIKISLTNNGETEIRVYTTKLQGYRIATDSEAICVDMGEPREIYKNIVVLDPGHGGPANGAQYFGAKEKDINLTILYTIGKKYFNSDTSKLKVYYTRYRDVDMGLSERAAFTQKVGADLFVSLHMNAAAQSARGTEVFYSVKSNSPNKAGLNSQKLAEILNTRLCSILGTKNRGVKTENHTVTYKNTVPAVLIELGFMSNEEDFALLTDEQFQDKAARTIYETLLEVFEKYPTGR